MKNLFNKIRALYSDNREIIDRVLELQHALHSKYVANLEDGLVLEEVPFTVKVADILKDLKFEAQLVTDILDVFIEKPNWQAKGWDDLTRLNRELFTAAEKFATAAEMFAVLDKNNKAATELAKYLQNFELLQTSLGAIEEKTLSEYSHQEMLAKANRLLAGYDVAQIIELVNRVVCPAFDAGSILSFEQAQQLAEWYGSGWTLLYKASRDGWASSEFHSRCDGKGPTVTVVRCSKGNVFGGHLAQSWNSAGGYIECSAASIFTLVNPHNIPPTRIAISDATGAAYGDPGFGPTFGGMFGLSVASNANVYPASRSNIPRSYEDTTGKGEYLFTGLRDYQAAEVEVFTQQQ